MTTIDPVSTASLYTGAASTGSERKQTLDSEVFLKLLVTQLANQDPSSPMNTNEMIGQTTQLASMEQLTALSTTTTENFALTMRQAAAALIGAQAHYVDDAGVEHAGKVDAVSFADTVPQLTIGGTTVALDAVSGLTALT
ncbi:flagellar hook capping protein [Microbacterium protaetiae]|uniref:Flagellar hook capping protein n=1 Tax=Microbacterium protaetiae TaxID=2509458 RepID=A0A4V0YDA9_9MICO|nr:flagellar hook capping FlgD N-terminal domain-containing protein [Microbacterium protaetiae]QAY60071.1 flagellar hook capping protein [Microbacterium protaetiae]